MRAGCLLVICGDISPLERKGQWPTTHALTVDKHGGFAPGLAARQQPERGRRETPCVEALDGK